MNGFVLKNNPHIGFFFPEGFQMKRSGNLVMLAVDIIEQTASPEQSAQEKRE